MLISTDPDTSYKTVKDLINAHVLTLVGDELTADKLVAHAAAVSEASAIPTILSSDLVVAIADNTVLCFNCQGSGHMLTVAPVLCSLWSCLDKLSRSRV